MTMRKMLSVIVIAAMFMAACGKSEEQKQAEKAAEDLKKAAEAMGQAAANAGTAAAAQGTTDMAKAMHGMAAAMGGKTADGKPVEPIAFQTLQDHTAGSLGLGDGQARGRAHDLADAVLANRGRLSARAISESTCRSSTPAFRADADLRRGR